MNTRQATTAPPVVRRIISFIDRVRWMAVLTGDYRTAAATVIGIRRARGAVHSLPFRGVRIKFRAQDEQAVREVLVDEEYGFLRYLLTNKPEPRVLDLGAHIGTFAIWTLSLNSNARVLSIEADPDTYETACSNAQIFAERGARWDLLHGAAGAAGADQVQLSTAGPSMSHRVDPRGEIAVRVLSLRDLLDRLVPEGNRVDLMKVDIEGSEQDFICSDTAAMDRVDALVIELHPTLCDAAKVRAVLEEHFDTIQSVGGRKSSKPLLYCTRRSGGASGQMPAGR